MSAPFENSSHLCEIQLLTRKLRHTRKEVLAQLRMIYSLASPEFHLPIKRQHSNSDSLGSVDFNCCNSSHQVALTDLIESEGGQLFSSLEILISSLRCYSGLRCSHDTILPDGSLQQQSHQIHLHSSQVINKCAAKRFKSAEEHVKHVSTSVFPVLSLPNELGISIISKLSIEDICRTRGTCKTFRAWCDASLRSKAVLSTKVSLSDSNLLWLTDRCRHLTVIDLSECFGVTDHGVIGLVQKNPHISRVNVACTDIGDELLVTLASTCSTTLSYLNVALTNVTDQGVVALWKCCNLKSLNVRCCDVSDRGLYILVQFCRKLRNLCVAHCQHVTDWVIPHLAGLKQLRKLDLHGCLLITDTTLSHFPLPGIVSKGPVWTHCEEDH